MFGFVAAVTLALGIQFPLAALAQDGTDPVTGFARDPVHVAAWPGGRKVAVSFALFVEEFGFGQGPVFRPDLATRTPDLVNEAFRQYGNRLGHRARQPVVQGIGCSAHHCFERRISRCAPGSVEGISCSPAELTGSSPTA